MYDTFSHFFFLSSPTSTSQFQSLGEEIRTREPIDYFSSYFGWDTWVEIANCTNILSNMTERVTAKEVAQFVGIHIAMGTLKVCALFEQNLFFALLIRRETTNI